jgi:hypothetical protein
MAFGQDRYKRRYWVLPFAGGIYVEGLESAEPELMTKVERKTPLDCDEKVLVKSECKLLKMEENNLKSVDSNSREIMDKKCENNVDSVDCKESDFATVLQNMMCVKKKDSGVKSEDQGPPKGEGLCTMVGGTKTEVADLDGAVKEEKKEVDGGEKISVKTEVDIKKEGEEIKMDLDSVKTELNSVKLENGDIMGECVKSKAIKMETEVNDLDVKVEGESVKVKDNVKVKEENFEVKEDKVTVKQEICELSLVNGTRTPPVNSLFQHPSSTVNLSDLARKSESPYLRNTGTPKKSDIFNNSALKTGASTESSPGFMSIDSILKKEDTGLHFNNSCSPFLPFPPSGPLSAEQMLKNLSERQGQKPWFSILPRMPCDESSLTRTPSNLSQMSNSQMSNSQMSNSPSPSPSPFFLPVPYSAFQVHNPMFASFQMGQLQYPPFNFSLPGSGYQPMKSSGIVNGDEGTPPHSSFNRSYETSTPNTSNADPERLPAPKPIPVGKLSPHVPFIMIGSSALTFFFRYGKHIPIGVMSLPMTQTWRFWKLLAYQSRKREHGHVSGT